MSGSDIWRSSGLNGADYVKDFGSLREALEYLVGRVVAEAKFEGIELSDLEQKMLYFSETDWSLPGILEVNREFECLYDTDEYEAKIAGLIQRLVRRAKAESEEEYRLWNDAEAKLREGDYYLLVMIDADPPPASSKNRWLPTWSDKNLPQEPGDRLRLWITALACVAGTIAVIALIAWMKGRE
jgi:hypothetical protein